MASKIPSRLKKDKTRGAKPYDRPNQSLLRKVASTVRDILVPSWLMNVSAWTKSDTEDGVSTSKASDVYSCEDANEPVPEQKPVAMLAKRPRYSYNSESASPKLVGMPTKKWHLNTTVKTQRTTEAVASQSQISQTCELGKKETQIVINGDDHSENSEGSASTSGCSSLVSSHQDRQDRSCSGGIRLSESALEHLREELKEKEVFQRKQRRDAAVSTESLHLTVGKSLSQNQISLWSHGIETALKQPSRPHSTIRSNKPSFSLSSFGGPVLGTSPISAERKVSSPFYEGKTTYGGASAYRRAQLSSLPYQNSKPTRSQITVKKNRTNDDFEYMSSAAKRILHSLEKMSTPLTDAKKIPSIVRSPLDISVSLTPASQRQSSYFSSMRKTPTTISTKGPPVSSIITTSRLPLMRNYNTKKANFEMEMHVSQNTSVLQNEQPRIATEDTSSPTKGGGGKIRSRLHQCLHQSSKRNEENEMVEEIALPNIPLPITELPAFNFMKKNTSNSSVNTLASDNKTASDGHLPFAFSSPIERLDPKTILNTQKPGSDTPFTFSSPLVVSEDSSGSSVSLASSTNVQDHNEEKSKKEVKETVEIVRESVNDYLKMLNATSRNKLEEKPFESKDKTCPNKNNIAGKGNRKADSSESGFGNKFKPEAGSWECSSCLVRNKRDVQKCVACETSKPNSLPCPTALPASKFDFTGLENKFKPETGNWECTTCCIRNKEEHSKCVACESLKPCSIASASLPVSSSTGFGDKFKPPAGSWECSSCLVRNKETDNKCLACESERPKAQKVNTSVAKGIEMKSGSSDQKEMDNSNKHSANSEKRKTTESSGSWECDTCMVRNPAEKSKCIACETSRLLNGKAIDTNVTFTGFKFEVPAQKSSPVPFKFGSIVSTSATTSSTTTFKFGVPTESSKPFDGFKMTTPTSTTSEGFKFSAPSTEPTGPSVISDNFKFGVPPTSEPSNKLQESFNFKAPEGISFNATVPKTTSSILAFSNIDSEQNKISDTENSKTATSKPSEEITLSNSSVDVGDTVKKAEPPKADNSTEHPKPIQPFSFGIPSFSSSAVTSALSTTTTTTTSGIGGFTFGNASTGVTQSPSMFKFGDKSEGIKIATTAAALSTQTAPIFTSATTFGTSSPSAFVFGSKPLKPYTQSESETLKNNVEKVPTPQQFPDGQQRQIPEVSSSTMFFGTTTSSSTPAKFVFGSNCTMTPSSAVPSFKFGTGSTTTTVAAPTSDTTSAQSSMFTFGNVAKTESSMPKQGFTFKDVTEEKLPSLPPNQSSFQGFKSDALNPVVTSSTVSSPFKFGTAVQTPVTSGGFVFGTPKTEVTTQAAPSPFGQFTFHGNTKPVNTSGFAGFSQSQPVTTASIPSFNFGSNIPNVPTVSGPSFSTSNNIFTFGAKNNSTAPTPINNAPGTPANTSTVFGCPTIQPVFGGSTTTTPAFGKAPQQKPEVSAGFNFGATSAVTPSPVFRFGAPQEKKPAAAPALTSGFNFNMPSQSESNSSFSQGFNPNTPPTFNFGVTSTPNMPFQFLASSESPSSSSMAPRRIRKAVRRNVRKPND